MVIGVIFSLHEKVFYKELKMKILYILIIVAFIPLISANTIDIYYPNNNTTTNILYSNNDGYNQTLNNTITGNFSIIILNDEKKYDNIIDSPHKVISPIFKLVMLIVLCFIGVFIVVTLKKVLK